jgi:hypothetical protein
MDNFKEGMGDFTSRMKQFNAKTEGVISGLPKPVIIGLTIIAVVGVAYIVRMYYARRKAWKRWVSCGRCYTRFENRAANIVGLRAIESSRLPNPNSGDDCTYSMWLYVADWTTNFGRWKSVFSKSPAFPTCSAGVKWDMVPDQCPGIWLADTVNDLRIVVQTQVAVPARCLASAANAAGVAEVALETPAKASAGGTLSFADCIKTPQRDMRQVPILEHVEMKNVPIGKWFQFTFILRENFVELYRDGQLHTTTALLGKPQHNVFGGRFAATNPFSGRMANFRYMPFALLLPMIRRLYSSESGQSFKDSVDPMKDDR